MGTVTNINGIDEDKKGEVSVRVVATLMAIGELMGRGVSPDKCHEFCAKAYKGHLQAAAHALEKADEYDANIHMMHEKHS